MNGMLPWPTQVPEVISLEIPRVDLVRSTFLGTHHSEYVIEVSEKEGGHRWAVRRRYRELVRLHEKCVGLPAPTPMSLEAGVGNCSQVIPPFPPKKVFGNLNPGFVETRRAALEAYLRGLLKHGEVTRTDWFWHFIGADEVTLIVARFLGRLSSVSSLRRSLHHMIFLFKMRQEGRGRSPSKERGTTNRNPARFIHKPVVQRLLRCLEIHEPEIAYGVCSMLTQFVLMFPNTWSLLIKCAALPCALRLVLLHSEKPGFGTVKNPKSIFSDGHETDVVEAAPLCVVSSLEFAMTFVLHQPLALAVYFRAEQGGLGQFVELLQVASLSALLHGPLALILWFALDVPEVQLALSEPEGQGLEILRILFRSINSSSRVICGLIVCFLLVNQRLMHDQLLYLVGVEGLTGLLFELQELSCKHLRYHLISEKMTQEQEDGLKSDSRKASPWLVDHSSEPLNQTHTIVGTLDFQQFQETIEKGCESVGVRFQKMAFQSSGCKTPALRQRSSCRTEALQEADLETSRALWNDVANTVRHLDYLTLYAACCLRPFLLRRVVAVLKEASAFGTLPATLCNEEGTRIGPMPEVHDNGVGHGVYHDICGFCLWVASLLICRPQHTHKQIIGAPQWFRATDETSKCEWQTRPVEHMPFLAMNTARPHKSSKQLLKRQAHSCTELPHMNNLNGSSSSAVVPSPMIYTSDVGAQELSYDDELSTARNRHGSTQQCSVADCDGFGCGLNNVEFPLRVFHQRPSSTTVTTTNSSPETISYRVFSFPTDMSRAIHPDSVSGAGETETHKFLDHPSKTVKDTGVHTTLGKEHWHSLDKLQGPVLQYKTHISNTVGRHNMTMFILFFKHISSTNGHVDVRDPKGVFFSEAGFYSLLDFHLSAAYSDIAQSYAAMILLEAPWASLLQSEVSSLPPGETTAAVDQSRWCPDSGAAPLVTLQINTALSEALRAEAQNEEKEKESGNVSCAKMSFPYRVVEQRLGVARTLLRYSELTGGMEHERLRMDENALNDEKKKVDYVTSTEFPLNQDIVNGFSTCLKNYMDSIATLECAEVRAATFLKHMRTREEALRVSQRTLCLNLESLEDKHYAVITQERELRSLWENARAQELSVIQKRHSVERSFSSLMEVSVGLRKARHALRDSRREAHRHRQRWMEAEKCVAEAPLRRKQLKERLREAQRREASLVRHINESVRDRCEDRIEMKQLFEMTGEGQGSAETDVSLGHDTTRHAEELGSDLSCPTLHLMDSQVFVAGPPLSTRVDLDAPGQLDATPSEPAKLSRDPLVTKGSAPKGERSSPKQSELTRMERTRFVESQLQRCRKEMDGIQSSLERERDVKLLVDKSLQIQGFVRRSEEEVQKLELDVEQWESRVQGAEQCLEKEKKALHQLEVEYNQSLMRYQKKLKEAETTRNMFGLDIVGLEKSIFKFLGEMTSTHEDRQLADVNISRLQHLFQNVEKSSEALHSYVASFIATLQATHTVLRHQRQAFDNNPQTRL